MRWILISSIMISIISVMVLAASYFTELPADLLGTASVGAIAGIFGLIMTVPPRRKLLKMRFRHA